MEHDQEFESTQSGASETYPQQCSGLRKNGHVVIKNRPCKIVDMSTSKTGKHGHAKVHLVGIDIFNGKKCEDMCPSTHNMMVPIVDRKEMEVVDLTSDGYFSLLNDDGEIREDLKLTEFCNPSTASEVLDMLKAAESSGEKVNASVLKAMGEEIVKDLRICKA